MSVRPSIPLFPPPGSSADFSFSPPAPSTSTGGGAPQGSVASFRLSNARSRTAAARSAAAAARAAGTFGMKKNKRLSPFLPTMGNATTTTTTTAGNSANSGPAMATTSGRTRRFLSLHAPPPATRSTRAAAAAALLQKGHSPSALGDRSHQQGLYRDGSGTSGPGGVTTPYRVGQVLTDALNRLQKKDKKLIFAAAVDKNLVPDYYVVIKEPMYFEKMKQKIRDRVYTSLDAFDADIALIISNCRLYNQPDTPYCRVASLVETCWHKLRERVKVKFATAAAQDADDEAKAAAERSTSSTCVAGGGTGSGAYGNILNGSLSSISGQSSLLRKGPGTGERGGLHTIGTGGSSGSPSGGISGGGLGGGVHTPGGGSGLMSGKTTTDQGSGSHVTGGVSEDFACSQDGNLGQGDPSSFSLLHRPRGASGTTSEELYLLLRMNRDPEAAEKLYRLKHGEAFLPEAEKEKGEPRISSSIKKETSETKKGGKQEPAASTLTGHGAAGAGGDKTRGKGDVMKSLTGFEGQRRDPFYWASLAIPDLPSPISPAWAQVLGPVEYAIYSNSQYTHSSEHGGSSTSKTDASSPPQSVPASRFSRHQMTYHRSIRTFLGEKTLNLLNSVYPEIKRELEKFTQQDALRAPLNDLRIFGVDTADFPDYNSKLSVDHNYLLGVGDGHVQAASTLATNPPASCVSSASAVGEKPKSEASVYKKKSTPSSLDLSSLQGLVQKYLHLRNPQQYSKPTLPPLLEAAVASGAPLLPPWLRPPAPSSLVFAGQQGGSGGISSSSPPSPSSSPLARCPPSSNTSSMSGPNPLPQNNAATTTGSHDRLGSPNRMLPLTGMMTGGPRESQPGVGGSLGATGSAGASVSMASGGGGGGIVSVESSVGSQQASGERLGQGDFPVSGIAGGMGGGFQPPMSGGGSLNERKSASDGADEMRDLNQGDSSVGRGDDEQEKKKNMPREDVLQTTVRKHFDGLIAQLLQPQQQQLLQLQQRKRAFAETLQILLPQTQANVGQTASLSSQAFGQQISANVPGLTDPAKQPRTSTGTNMSPLQQHQTQLLAAQTQQRLQALQTASGVAGLLKTQAAQISRQQQVVSAALQICQKQAEGGGGTLSQGGGRAAQPGERRGQTEGSVVGMAQQNATGLLASWTAAPSKRSGVDNNRVPQTTGGPTQQQQHQQQQHVQAAAQIAAQAHLQAAHLQAAQQAAQKQLEVTKLQATQQAVQRQLQSIKMQAAQQSGHFQQQSPLSQSGQQTPSRQQPSPATGVTQQQQVPLASQNSLLSRAQVQSPTLDSVSAHSHPAQAQSAARVSLTQSQSTQVQPAASSQPQTMPVQPVASGLHGQGAPRTTGTPQASRNF
ncbi:bromodomain-containing protein [Cystoisospora suis]|uniref:Bromodomain-containing protein n=1 Tax=Cystoisospora suis TaxID=483139 RepID=A0A2C6L6C9_9APIC|nr:bromodomain-containing protein [Cystoisospora suis]